MNRSPWSALLSVGFSTFLSILISTISVKIIWIASKDLDYATGPRKPLGSRKDWLPCHSFKKFGLHNAAITFRRLPQRFYRPASNFRNAVRVRQNAQCSGELAVGIDDPPLTIASDGTAIAPAPSGSAERVGDDGQHSRLLSASGGRRC